MILFNGGRELLEALFFDKPPLKQSLRKKHEHQFDVHAYYGLITDFYSDRSLPTLTLASNFK